MLYWIFDLDETLYHLDTPFQYEDLKKDKYLDFMLSMLPGKKIIFTNATYDHAIRCLNLIGIEKHFSDIEARDTLDGLKPSPFIYERFIYKQNISPNDICVFFEDTINNLDTAKTYFRWKTIFINRHTNEKNDNVDMKFNNIHQCLEFFVKNICLSSKN